LKPLLIRVFGQAPREYFSYPFLKGNIKGFKEVLKDVDHILNGKDIYEEVVK
jgi:hypothetical protein